MKILENLPLFASSACKAIKALLLWQRFHLESTMTTFPPPVRDYFLRSLWLSQRRHILNFNLALFILFGFIFSASGLPHFKRTLRRMGPGRERRIKIMRAIIQPRNCYGYCALWEMPLLLFSFS